MQVGEILFPTIIPHPGMRYTLYYSPTWGFWAKEPQGDLKMEIVFNHNYAVLVLWRNGGLTEKLITSIKFSKYTLQFIHHHLPTLVRFKVPIALIRLLYNYARRC